jgi:hypothetical protein
MRCAGGSAPKGVSSFYLAITLGTANPSMTEGNDCLRNTLESRANEIVKMSLFCSAHKL